MLQTRASEPVTIRKGEAWGEPSGAPVETVLASDAAVAAYVAKRPGSTVSAATGDLNQTLGLSDGPRSEPLWFPMDLGFVTIDGRDELPFAAHVIARGRLWLGEGAAVMNAAWLGDRYLGPRSHPNDALLDVTVGSLPPRQLLAAAKRVKTGVHLPHPALAVKRVGAWEHTFDRPRSMWVDGQHIGRAEKLACRIESDWFTLVG